MKLFTTPIVLAAALVLPLTACSQESTQAAAKDMGAMASEAAQALTKQFNEIKGMAEMQTKAVEPAIADLKQKAEAKGAEAKTSIDALIADLMKKKDEIQAAVAGLDLKNVSAKSIEDLKKKVEPMLTELKQLLDKAKSM